MGDECLNTMLSILRGAGLRAQADYPAGGWMELAEAVAAVGLDILDCGAGKAVFTVRILSPGRLGGWHCQNTAAAVSAALDAFEISCSGSRMEYLSGSDCFCAALRAELDVFFDGTLWHPGHCWKYTCEGSVIRGVTEFTAVLELDRRLIGAGCQGEPVGVTPASGGWRLKLVQMIPVNGNVDDWPEEPFELAAIRGDRVEIYSGCCWNQTSAVHTQAGLRLERQGFALSREVK